MTVEQREKDERGVSPEVKEKLVQKLESYLRAHFDEESAKHCTDGTMERLLLEVGQDWCINRGVSLDSPIVWDACEEAIKRYRKNWEGKKQGEDVRGGKLGRVEQPRINKYQI